MSAKPLDLKDDEEEDEDDEEEEEGEDEEQEAEAPSKPPGPPPPPILGGPLAAFIAWLIVGDANAVMIEFVVPRRPDGRMVRLLQHAYDLGNHVAAALLTAVLVYGWARVRDRVMRRTRPWLKPVADAVALFTVALIAGWRVLPQELTSFAAITAEKHHWSTGVVHRVAIMGVVAGVPLGNMLGRMFDRAKFRLVAIGLAVVITIQNSLVLRHDYEAAHLYLAFLSAAIAGGALVHAHRVRLRRPIPERAWYAVMAALAAFAAWSVLVRPRPLVVGQLLAEQGSVFTPILAQIGADQAAGAQDAVIPPEQAEWFKPRKGLPAIPPSGDELVKDPIVILFTIDSLRYDVIASGKFDKFLPTLSEMRDHDVFFTDAHTPGAQTVYTFSSLFTGKYFSQLYWSTPSVGIYWPSRDTSRRWPQELHTAGVRSINYKSCMWIDPKHGLAVGFDFEQELLRGKGMNEYGHGVDVARRIQTRLKDLPPGPFFLFAHIMDAHAPYERVGGNSGTPYQKYIHALHGADEALGMVRKTVEELGLADRTVFIVSADHGEAFGDHGTFSHGVSVYEELIHVPLFIRGPGFEGRRVSTPVTLLDLGPTILDIFRVPTSAVQIGQSLLPLLRTGESNFTRPILAEDRLKQAMLFPDGVKAIRDLHTGADELYDLNKDPKELDNRIEDPSLDPKGRLGLIGAFYKAHAYAAPGYTTPLRK